jgi:predicted nucleotidyltransferase
METVDAILAELVQAARAALRDDLLSVVLFGSAAEGRLRASSDVNVLMLLKAFDVQRIDILRGALRVAHAAARVETMFLLVEELPVAAELFAVKFNDICHRHRVLFGPDPLQSFAIEPAELRRRLREVLLNLAIRLRERYALVSLRDEQLAKVLAEVAGPLRAAAAALLQLQGKVAVSPREALETVASATGDSACIEAVALIAQARQQGQLAFGSGGPALIALSCLATYLRVTLEAA